MTSEYHYSFMIPKLHNGRFDYSCSLCLLDVTIVTQYHRKIGRVSFRELICDDLLIFNGGCFLEYVEFLKQYEKVIEHAGYTSLYINAEVIRMFGVKHLIDRGYQGNEQVHLYKDLGSSHLGQRNKYPKRQVRISKEKELGITYID